MMMTSSCPFLWAARRLFRALQHGGQARRARRRARSSTRRRSGRLGASTSVTAGRGTCRLATRWTSWPRRRTSSSSRPQCRLRCPFRRLPSSSSDSYGYHPADRWRRSSRASCSVTRLMERPMGTCHAEASATANSSLTLRHKWCVNEITLRSLRGRYHLGLLLSLLFSLGLRRWHRTGAGSSPFRRASRPLLQQQPLPRPLRRPCRSRSPLHPSRSKTTLSSTLCRPTFSHTRRCAEAFCAGMSRTSSSGVRGASRMSRSSSGTRMTL